MRHSALSTLLVLSVIYLNICQCSKNETALDLFKEQKELKTIQEVGRKLQNIWTWIKQQAGSEDTFVGRCAGALKKMKMLMNFIIFKLGIIMTTLVFLSVLAFKSVGIGVIILIISAVGLATKFSAVKHEGGHQSHSPAVHLHVYNKGGYGHGGGGGHYHSHDDAGWYDRLGHSGIAKNSMERLAIADLYKRLGITGNSYGSTSTGSDTWR